MPIAPSTYHEHVARRADPARLSDHAKRDAALRTEIQRVFDANWQVYGARKIWRQLRRESFDVARCTATRLMKSMGIQGIIRGKPHKTTIPDKKQPCPLDRVNRQFRVPAPNMLWVSDFTYVATWKGFVHVAFVIDAYARHIVGWRVSTPHHAGFVLDALEQAVHERRPVKPPCSGAVRQPQQAVGAATRADLQRNSGQSRYEGRCGSRKISAKLPFN